MKICRKIATAVLFGAFILVCAACGETKETSGILTDTDISSAFVYEESMPLDYAEQFAVYYYNDGFALIATSDGSRFLVNTEGKDVPEDLDGDIVVLDAPAERIYLAASAAMDMFCSIGALDTVSLSGIEQENWYIEEAKAAMESGELLYAGKYNAPDYELICAKECSLAIESTMILHVPEVKENLEGFGIPVFIDRSSYESHPLGRTEWVKVYGVLTGKEAEALAAFEEQKAIFEGLGGTEDTKKTVAYFYFTANGAVNVRKSNDYVAKMILLAGGEYIFSDLGDEDSASSAVTLQMEDFYAQAKDADYLIYNSYLDGNMKTLDDLLAKNGLLEDFAAVQNGNVWCTTQNIFQDTMDTASIIRDIHDMLTLEVADTDELTYMYRLK